MHEFVKKNNDSIGDEKTTEISNQHNHHYNYQKTKSVILNVNLTLIIGMCKKRNQIVYITYHNKNDIKGNQNRSHNKKTLQKIL